MTFAKPIDHELVCEFDFLNFDARDDTHLQFIFLLTKEDWAKSAVGEFHQQKQALSRFYVGAALMSDSWVLLPTVLGKRDAWASSTMKRVT